MTDKERALRHLGITMRGYRTEYGTPILTDVSVKDAIAGVVAAVRAETLREVRGVVEGMDDGYGTNPGYSEYPIGFEEAITKVLAAIGALAQPEGT